MKYAFIQQHRQAFSFQRMCAVPGVARNATTPGDSAAVNRPPRRRLQAITDQRVAQAFQQRKGRSGAPRLTHDLNDAGVSISRNTVAASLRRQNLRAKAACKYKATTNSRYGFPVAPNLLKQDFTAAAPNQKWASDITYWRPVKAGFTWPC